MLSMTIFSFSSSLQRRRRPVSTISSRSKALCVFLSIRTVLNLGTYTPQGGLRRRLTGHASAAAGARRVNIGPVRGLRAVVDGLRRCRDAEKRAYALDTGFTIRAGQEAVMPDAMEAPRQDVAFIVGTPTPASCMAT